MDRRTADWSRAGPNDLPRAGRARLIAAAISVVLSATALVAVLFGAGPGHVQPRHVPVQAFGKYILLSVPGEATFGAARPHPRGGARHAA